MNIINSDILTTQYDVFWQDAHTFTATLHPAPVLVVTAPLQSGSAEQVQLQKMIDACKLSYSQYNIVSIPAGTQVAWHKLRAALQPNVVLLLGIVPATLGISALMKYCEPNRFDDVIWLPAPSVENLANQPEVKKQLWNQAMKPVFIDMAYGDILQAGSR